MDAFFEPGGMSVLERGGMRVLERGGMRIPGLGMCVVAAALVASPASAQFERTPSRAGPALDSIRIMYESRPVWRGFLLGRTALAVDLDVALAGYATTTAGDWGLAIRGGGSLIRDVPEGAASSGHVEGGPVFSWRLERSADAAAIEVAAGGYWLPDADSASSGLGVGVRLTRLEWDWGRAETNPTLGLALHRDFGRFDGFMAEAAFDLGLGGRILAFGPLDGAEVAVEGRVRGWHFDRGSPDRDRLGGRAGLVVSLEKSWLALVLRAGVMDPVDAGTGGYFAAGFRIWPDAAASGVP